MDKSNPLMEQMTVLRAEANALGTSDDIAKREKDMEDLKHLQLAEQKQDRLDRNATEYIKTVLTQNLQEDFEHQMQYQEVVREGYMVADAQEAERARRLEEANND